MIEQGAFHDVLIAEEVVARVSRSRFAADAMDERIHLLERLRGRVGHLEVPTVLSRVERWSDERAGALLSLVPGRSNTSDEQIPASAVADVLAQIRLTDPAALEGSTVRAWCGGDEFARIVADEVAPGLPADVAALANRVVSDLLESEAEAPKGPIHGDLTPFNIRWNGRRAVGLLDWDSAGLGDTAVDVAGILTTLGTTTAQQVCDEATLARAALHRATFPLQIACAGHLHDDQRLRSTGIKNFRSRAESHSLHWPE